jgi:BON domain
LLLRAIWRYFITGMHHALFGCIGYAREKADRPNAILSAGAFMRDLDRLALIGVAVFAVGVFGCGPAARTETTTTTTTRYTTATSRLILPSQPTSETTTTITSAPGETVERRTTTTYRYPDVDDAVIEARVRTAIKTDPGVEFARARFIGIASNSGVVQLSGVVGSISELQEASIQASEVPDVRQVDNDPMIGPQPFPAVG